MDTNRSATNLSGMFRPRSPFSSPAAFAAFGPWAVALLLVLGPGCASKSPVGSANALPPRNVYVETGLVPGHIKRVAMLPVAIAPGQSVLEEGRSVAQPILFTEFLQSAKFEFIQVTPEQCQRWTGHPQIRTADALPHDLFTRVREDTGADAVLFAELTHYRPYPPVAVGWRLQLLVLDPKRVLWSVDELFDAADPAVADAACDYFKIHFKTTSGGDPVSILSSPRRFVRYTGAAMALTLPTH